MFGGEDESGGAGTMLGGVEGRSAAARFGGGTGAAAITFFFIGTEGTGTGRTGVEIIGLMEGTGDRVRFRDGSGDEIFVFHLILS